MESFTRKDRGLLTEPKHSMACFYFMEGNMKRGFLLELFIENAPVLEKTTVSIVEEGIPTEHGMPYFQVIMLSLFLNPPLLTRRWKRLRCIGSMFSYKLNSVITPS